MKTLRGAEAIISARGKTIRKVRPRKSYRNPALDKSLRGFRTRREAKILEALARVGVRVPALIDFSDKTMSISMQKLDGKTVREALTLRNCTSIGAEIGSQVGLMHSHEIVHGDLTTSNMMLAPKLTLIDFGLSFFSNRTEDAAVDVHLFKETVFGTHPLLAEKLYASFLSGYKKTNAQWKSVFSRLDVVEARGRNKRKNGS